MTDQETLGEWALLNLSKGKTPESILNSALATRSYLEASQALEYAYRKTNLFPWPNASIKPLVVDLVNQFAVMTGLITETECDLIVREKALVYSSSNIIDDSGINSIYGFRVSNSTRLHGTPEIEAIDKRLADLLGWPIKDSEISEIIKYDVGGHFKPHRDTYEPIVLQQDKTIRQRVATLITYLNDPDDGGGTQWPELGLTVNPRKGMSVLFVYPPGYNSKSLHAGLPVLCGTKYVSVKWFLIT